MTNSNGIANNGLPNGKRDVMTEAVRNINNPRGNFGKLVWPVWRKQIEKAYTNCQQEYLDIIYDPEKKNPRIVIDEIEKLRQQG